MQAKAVEVVFSGTYAALSIRKVRCQKARTFRVMQIIKQVVKRQPHQRHFPAYRQAPKSCTDEEQIHNDASMRPATEKPVSTASLYMQSSMFTMSPLVIPGGQASDIFPERKRTCPVWGQCEVVVLILDFLHTAPALRALRFAGQPEVEQLLYHPSLSLPTSQENQAGSRQ
jgi:hypothetical protein